MGENTYFFEWSEEIVDTIIASICEVISKEGGNNPIPIVEREYEKLPSEKQFLLQYFTALYWGEKHNGNYVALAKLNVVDVWNAVNYVP